MGKKMILREMIVKKSKIKVCNTILTLFSSYHMDFYIFAIINFLLWQIG